MTSTNLVVLRTMNVLFWTLFIGLCIKTGAILVSFIVSLSGNAAVAVSLTDEASLDALFSFNTLYYIQTVSLLIFLTGMKAHIAYLVVQIFMTFKFTDPFHEKITALISRISQAAFAAGILALIATAHSKWLMKKGAMVSIGWGAGEILFFAGVLYLIAIVFRKGTDLQNETDLTV